MNDGLGGSLIALTPDYEKTIETTRIIKNVFKGRLYQFKYRLQNINGWS